MEYDSLDRNDFDAAVTGELTHRALHFENTLISIITDFFVAKPSRQNAFKRVILYREGLTFQAKIEIVRALLPLFDADAKRLNLSSILNRIEDFKAFRNAMAHGVDVGNHSEPHKLKVEIVSRSGKEKSIEITPQTHIKMLNETDTLQEELDEAYRELKKVFEKLK